MIEEVHYIQAIRATDYTNRCLFLDGINDELWSNNSAFYDFGTGPFALVIRCLPTTSGAIVLSKGSGSGSAGYRIRLGGTSDNIDNSCYIILPTGQQYVWTLPEVVRNRWVTIIFQRVGTNDAPSTDTANWPGSNRNPDNYQLFINGEQKQFRSRLGFSGVSANFTELVSSNVDNTGELVLGRLANNSGLFHRGPIDFAAIYNRALTPEEAYAIELTGELPADETKGNWEFNQAVGKQVLDNSSVGNIFNLMGYTDAETGIPDFTTNRAWVPTESVQVFQPNASNVTHSFLFPRDTQVTGFRRFIVANLTGSWLHLRNDVVLNSGSLSFDSSGYMAASFDVLAGDEMRYTGSNSSSSNCVIVGMFYV